MVRGLLAPLSPREVRELLYLFHGRDFQPDPAAFRRPTTKEVIYFELPQELGIESLRAEVHVYIFDVLPSSPIEALNNLQSERAGLRCSTLGSDKDRGNLEVRADWYVDDRKRAMLRPTQPPFRPNAQSGMQQVREPFSVYWNDAPTVTDHYKTPQGGTAPGRACPRRGTWSRRNRAA